MPVYVRYQTTFTENAQYLHLLFTEVFRVREPIATTHCLLL